MTRKGGGKVQNNYQRAHKFSSQHRKALEKDKNCGCFYCLATFPPTKIEEWCDNEQTALCPYCGIDSIIGESSGFPITKEFLKGMHSVWF